MRADADLLLAWRDGDSVAGEELVERHLESVCRFFHRRVSDVADDLTQATFIACQESASKLRSAESFRAFLFGIARNLLLRHLRDHARVGGVESVGQLEDLQTSIPGRIERAAQHRRLRKALAVLSFDDQLIIGMHYWDGLKLAEVAYIMDKPLGTIKWRLAEARSRLGLELQRLGRSDPALIQSSTNDFEAWAASLVRPEHGTDGEDSS